MKLIKLLQCAALLLAASAAAQPALALTPDQIALVANRAVPESADLAMFYAQARGIPADRIILLDLPTVDELSLDRYDRDVTPPIRQFLRDRGLADRVRCLVTFYGVPLRVGQRANSVFDTFELNRLKLTGKQIVTRLAEMVGQVEKQAAGVDAQFKPASTDESMDGLARRADHAGRTIAQAFQKETDPQRRAELGRQLQESAARFAAPVEAPNSVSPDNPTTAPVATPAGELIEKPYDREARSQLRELARHTGGIFGYARVIQNQIEYLATDATGSAVDNELALLWWPAYARAQWQPNTLNPHFKEMRSAPVMMVMRLDAESPQKVRDLIANTLAAEREGLKGRFAIDARGIAPKDGSGMISAFGAYDERLRTLEQFIKNKTDVPVEFDNNPAVFAAGAVEDVALYCGWYSLRNYVPGMRFNRGAVGYHIASFELVTLHNPLESGWVRGLLNSGVVGTLGPVAEPYLHSFPLPEEFFPLLMTGKLTLAEVYWTTTPLTSWMQTCIGDPLYNPYGKSPKVRPEDLPPLLKSALP